MKSMDERDIEISEAEALRRGFMAAKELALSQCRQMEQTSPNKHHQEAASMLADHIDQIGRGLFC